MDCLQKLLIDSIQDPDELRNIHINNKDFSQIYDKCFDYCINTKNTSKINDLLFEIDCVIDFLHDDLNTGHWSEVALTTRRGFTSASFVKCLLILKKSNEISAEALQGSLKCLDLGLLLGAPLQENAELLCKAAKILSVKLSAFTEDNAKSSVEVNKFEDEESFGVKFEDVPGLEVDCIECPSLEHFNKTYFVRQTPVKLQGCMTHWPALKKWLDINYLLKIAGDRTVPVEIGSHYVDEDWSQKLMLLKDFIKEHYYTDKKAKETNKIGYLAQHNLFDQITELKDDIYIPEYCCLSQDYENSTDADINAWLGPKGTVSPLHQDPKNNILAQVYGAKQLILFSPEDTEYLYPYEDKLLSNTAQIDPLNPDLTKFPNFRKAKMFKCLLRPSEMLFIPVKWWHHVTALDKSFSVSFWWQ